MSYLDFTKQVNRRLRRKRRIELVLVLLVVLVAMVCVYLTAAHVARPWLDKLDGIGAIPEPSGVVVTIVPDDTLWRIASQHYPGQHTGEIVMMIRKLNPDLSPGRLQVGQKVILPEVG